MTSEGGTARSAATELLILLARQDLDPARIEQIEQLARPGAALDEQAFVFLAEEHRLAPLVAANVRRLNRGGAAFRLGSGTRRILNALGVFHAGANAVMADEIRLIVGATAAAGAPVVLRKGGQLAFSTYRDPGLRPMSDLDLLVAPGAEADLTAVLEDLGYTQGVPDADGTSIRPLDRRRQIFWNLYGSDLPKLNKLTGTDRRPVVSIDVNTSLMLPGKEYEIPVGEVFARARTEKFAAGHEGMVLSPEDTLLDLCLHLYKNSTTLFFMHAGKHRRLIKYVDLAEFVTSHGDLDWPAVLDRARRYGVEPPVWFSLAHVETVFPGTVPGPVLDRLREALGEPEAFLDQYGQWDLPEPARWPVPLRDRLFDRSWDRELPRARSLL
ncbi:nucleotidyltransferase family protein [Streptomyces chartreusis]|uniref:nucleotidyltransferase family protein n=1 Tax=Streptomyces chartreusis TaxID=1969 RepID=UPI0033A37B50